ncbi:tetratricopeptide (TPR) repeat protein [Aequitasia blattaphilus]|uniref:Tetratricopeptide repeat protein n=1 Tax=Aequitasia blattaphilus TaxID=2949332 RepID=A0ABT1E7X4_9FIRM|nr:tetratricopeptide repeat protein [Aequitasia blattaphilus]MCP1101926.1 tetratricopeptide repeat protein [Aequitasia blattaphilus]MCR8614566.1 tetratricopeptide repeat protein [Aequitasia blattaphilus]
MDYKTKLLYQSNYWYNDGLRKANIRDLSGAIVSLRRSLQYNSDNIATRNLLGLVYYGRGDIVEGLVEWILSKNLQPQENIANYFIHKIQEDLVWLKTINQGIKKYNQALVYANQNGEDLATIQLKQVVKDHPTFVKAYQLLTLLLIDVEEYEEAKKYIRTAHQLDKTSDITLSYMQEITEGQKEQRKTAKIVREKTKANQSVEYMVGNETIIAPVNSGIKEHMGTHTLLNILLGAVLGVAVVLFLIMPSVVSDKQKELNGKTISFSERIATQEAQISALKKELESYRADAPAEDAQETAASTQNSYEVVMGVYTHYVAQDVSDSEMIEELFKVSVPSLGPLGKSTYDEVAGGVFPRACQSLIASGEASLNAGEVDAAITDLEKVIRMNDGYEDGKALYLLGQAYGQKGDSEWAREYYNRLVEQYGGSQYVQGAQEALNAL